MPRAVPSRDRVATPRTAPLLSAFPSPLPLPLPPPPRVAFASALALGAGTGRSAPLLLSAVVGWRSTSPLKVRRAIRSRSAAAEVDRVSAGSAATPRLSASTAPPAFLDEVALDVPDGFAAPGRRRSSEVAWARDENVEAELELPRALTGDAAPAGFVGDDLGERPDDDESASVGGEQCL